VNKACNRCGAFKPLDQFYKHQFNKDRKENVCAKCRKEASRKNQIKNREQFKKYDRRRDRSEKRKAWKKEYRAKGAK